MSIASACGVCHRPRGAIYRLHGGDVRCLAHAVRHPAVLRRSFVTALIVGTVLTAINQGDHLIHADVTAVTFLKMGLTYCVPFLVSTSGALGAARMRPNDGR